MCSRKTRALLCVLLGGMALAGAAQLQVHGRRLPALPPGDTTPTASLIGSPAPDFELPLAAGCPWPLTKSAALLKDSAAMPTPISTEEARTLRFADFRSTRSAAQAAKGDVTLLVFWAFWCDTWKDATQRFQRLRPQFEQNGVRVLCVTVDASQQPVARSAFADGRIWYPVAIDRDSQVALSYGVRRVPTLFVIDAAGIVRARYEAFPNEHRLMDVIRQANKPAKQPSGGV